MVLTRGRVSPARKTREQTELRTHIPRDGVEG